MTFEQLLSTGAIEQVSITPRELGALLALARRDLATARGLTSSDLDWALAIAYNAILQSSVAYMGWRGYRAHGGKGHHYNTFRFMEEALPEERAMISRIQRLRRKRNTTLYEQVGLVGEREAHDVIEFAGRYYKQIASKLPAEITRLSDKEDDS
jgi:uncharacterized protein (UPF0332 family)